MREMRNRKKIKKTVTGKSIKDSIKCERWSEKLKMIERPIEQTRIKKKLHCHVMYHAVATMKNISS
jgi:hypothetical protein